MHRSALRTGGALALGVGLAGVYLVPLMAYRPLFDDRQMPNYLPDFEFGRYFLFLTTDSLAHPGVLVGAITVVCFSAIAACYLWKTESPASLKAAMWTAIVLGWAAMIPEIGSRMTHGVGFRFSESPAPWFFSQRMFLILFPVLLLGVVSFCAIGRGCDPRGRVLLGSAAASFVLMVPGAAWVWKAIPALAVFQFPYRLGGLLHVSVVGLLALAIDRTRSIRVDWRRSPPRWLIAGAAICVAVGGAVTWRIDRAFVQAGTPKFDPSRDVDGMFRTYVDPPAIPAFAASIGAQTDGFDVAPIPWERGRAGLSAGEGSIRVDRETWRSWRVTADTRGDARAWIGQTYSPLWRMVPLGDSSAAPSLRASPQGLLEVSLPAGRRSFFLLFDGGHAEALGLLFSAAALLVVAVNLGRRSGSGRHVSNHTHLP
jgi:hypothetical protein